MAKYNKEITVEICGYLENGNNQEDSARLAGIGESTFYEWKIKHPEFTESIKKAESICKSRNIGIIQKAAVRSWQAAAWYLERKYNEEYALKSVLEHQGNKEKPVLIQLDINNEEKAI